MLTLLLAFGALAVLAAGASSSPDSRRVWVPPASTEAGSLAAAAPPTCLPMETRMPEPRVAAPSAWLAYFASSGCVAAPPEAPRSDADVAATGDVDKLPMDGDLGAKGVYRALFLEQDPGELLMLGDRVADNGYLFAANRLRKKAFRLIV